MCDAILKSYECIWFGKMWLLVDYLHNVHLVSFDFELVQYKCLFV